MNHKKAKDLIPIQAKKEGIPEQDMSDIINAYWKENRKVLEKVTYIRLYIEGLGTFTTRYNRLRECIATQQAYILRNTEKLVNKNATGSNALITEMDKLDHMKSIVAIWKKEYEYMNAKQKEKTLYKRTKIKDTSKSNEIRRKVTKSMGEQEPDN